MPNPSNSNNNTSSYASLENLLPHFSQKTLKEAIISSSFLEAASQKPSKLPPEILNNDNIASDALFTTPCDPLLSDILKKIALVQPNSQDALTNLFKQNQSRLKTRDDYIKFASNFRNLVKNTHIFNLLTEDSSQVLKSIKDLFKRILAVDFCLCHFVSNKDINLKAELLYYMCKDANQMLSLLGVALIGNTIEGEENIYFFEVMNDFITIFERHEQYIQKLISNVLLNKTTLLEEKLLKTFQTELWFFHYDSINNYNTIGMFLIHAGHHQLARNYLKTASKKLKYSEIKLNKIIAISRDEIKPTEAIITLLKSNEQNAEMLINDTQKQALNNNLRQLYDKLCCLNQSLTHSFSLSNKEEIEKTLVSFDSIKALENEIKNLNRENVTGYNNVIKSILVIVEIFIAFSNDAKSEINYDKLLRLTISFLNFFKLQHPVLLEKLVYEQIRIISNNCIKLIQSNKAPTLENKVLTIKPAKKRKKKSKTAPLENKITENLKALSLEEKPLDNLHYNVVEPIKTYLKRFNERGYKAFEINTVGYQLLGFTPFSRRKIVTNCPKEIAVTLGALPDESLDGSFFYTGSIEVQCDVSLEQATQYEEFTVQTIAGDTNGGIYDLHNAVKDLNAPYVRLRGNVKDILANHPEKILYWINELNFCKKQTILLEDNTNLFENYNFIQDQMSALKKLPLMDFLKNLNSFVLNSQGIKNLQMIYRLELIPHIVPTTQPECGMFIAYWRSQFQILEVYQKQNNCTLYDPLALLLLPLINRYKTQTDPYECVVNHFLNWYQGAYTIEAKNCLTKNLSILLKAYWGNLAPQGSEQLFLKEVLAPLANSPITPMKQLYSKEPSAASEQLAPLSNKALPRPRRFSLGR